MMAVRFFNNLNEIEKKMDKKESYRSKPFVGARGNEGLQRS